MAAMRALSRATYLALVTRPLYYITLLLFGLVILISPYFMLFQFAKESQMVREMGVATMTLWGLILVAMTAGSLVTNELEDKTALLLLSKPLRRSHFLLGKFLGMLWAQALGIVFLSLMFLLTLWYLDGPAQLDRFTSDRSQSIWPFMWESFLGHQITFVLQAGLMCIFQLAIMSAICMCMAAFFPNIVTVSATALLFILGNVSAHFVANLQRSSSAPVWGLAQLLSYVLPNLSYFNLQIHFSEGTLVSLNYLLLLTCYTIIYICVVIRFAALIFETREVR
jgi:hypothetical protein